MIQNKSEIVQTMVKYLLPCLSVMFLTSLCPGQQTPLAETDTFRVEKIHPGYNGLGINFFTATIHNKTNQMQLLGLDLVADPQFCLIREQRQHVCRLNPFETKQIEAGFTFRRITTESTLRVRFGTPSVSRWGMEVKNIFFDKKFPIRDSSWTATFDLAHFTQKETNHFRIYCYRGSLSEKEIDHIALTREAGVAAVSRILQVSPSNTIRLIFYPDAERKTYETGHTGVGLARGNDIVEIYNDTIQLDPYHEVAHIVARELGNPPALFNEGFAVYAAEHLGADALRYLGAPGLTSNAVTATNRRKQTLFPLTTLFAFTEIGSQESRPLIAYPQAASFVEFLITSYGLEKFRKAYATLKNSNEKTTIDTNREAMQSIYARSLTELEQEWIHTLH